MQHLSGDQHVDVAELKRSIVDVECTDASGRQFVVEMQVLKVEGFEKRVVYNASKAYVMRLRRADEYPALCDVVGVTDRPGECGPAPRRASPSPALG